VIDVGAGIILINNHLHITITLFCRLVPGEWAKNERPKIPVMGLQAFNSLDSSKEAFGECREAL